MGRQVLESQRRTSGQRVAVEFTHAPQDRPSRRTVQLATVASWPPKSAALVSGLLRKVIWATEAISGEGGRTAPLIGRDEVRMAGMLQRVLQSVRLCLAASQVLRRTSADDLA
jgi:hypothetical protein